MKNSTALINALQAFENNQAIFYLTAGAVLISFSGVWVKLAHVTPTISGFYRVFFGGIFLLTAAFRQGEISWKGWRHLALGFTAGFFLSLDLFFWHSSIRYIGPGLATLLGNFQVFLLAAVGMLFMGEKLSLKFFFSILMAIIGLFLIVGLQWNQVSPQYKIGVYFGLTTAVVYTGYILSLRKLQSDKIGGSVFYTMMTVSFATSLFLGIKAYCGGDTFIIPDVQSGLALTMLGLSSQGIGWVLITYALPQVSASFVGLILLLQPSLAFVWDVLFFQRKTSSANWIGVIFVISAIYLGMSKSPADNK